MTAGTWASCDVRCGDQDLECLSVVESGIGAVVFRTAVDAVGVEVHSSFVQSQPDLMAVAHMVVVDGRAPRPLSHTTIGSPTDIADRRRLFVEHVAYLREALVERVGPDATLVVSPSAVD